MKSVEGGSSFENSLKRKIYVHAAVKDSVECSKLRRVLKKMTTILVEEEDYLVRALR